MRKSFYLCFSLQTWNAGVWLGLFFVIAGSAVSAFAQTSDATAHAIANIRERDGLRVKNYEALDVYISLNDETTKLGITGDTVRTRVESRLRQANIQPVDPVSRDHQAIVVNIDVVGQAFHVEINFMRWAIWYLPNDHSTIHPETVWNTGVIGEVPCETHRYNPSTGEIEAITHESDSDYILSSLDRALDRFLNAYLKANQ